MSSATVNSNASPKLGGLPSFDEMYDALCRRDSRYEGVFIVGVTSTGIFCRPTCSARKPKRSNVAFYRSNDDAQRAGFRACKRCKPLESATATPPEIQRLLSSVDSDLSQSWTDQRLTDLGFQPATIRRWFKKTYGMTFQSYLRNRRMTAASTQIKQGLDVTNAAIDSGYQSLSGFREAFQKWCGDVPSSAKSLADPIRMDWVTTPLGRMFAGVIDDTLCLLEFADRVDLESQVKSLVKKTGRQAVLAPHDLLQKIEVQLSEYFRGERTEFELPLTFPGTEFQRTVWNALQEIPYGEVRSYKQLAEGIGNASAQRAVGRTNGLNRIAIVIPCHRVVRSDGKLGGYAGDIWRKQRLLDLENSEVRLFD